MRIFTLLKLLHYLRFYLNINKYLMLIFVFTLLYLIDKYHIEYLFIFKSVIILHALI